jgi:hypothetical protein
MNAQTTDLYEIIELITNNTVARVIVPLGEEFGMVIKRDTSHFVGYKEQPVVEVSYYESEGEGSFAMYATEYFNVNDIENAALAVIDRANSPDPMEISGRSKPFEETFEAE